MDLTTTLDRSTNDPDAPPQPSASMIGRRWSASVLGTVDEDRPRRRVGDITRVVVATALVAIAAAGSAETTDVEAAFANLFASLPGGLEPVWEILAAVTPIVAGVLLLVGVLAGRFRLLLTQVLAIAATLLAGAAVAAVVEVPAGAQSLDGGQPDFPVLLLAAGVAALLVSRSYLTRPAGRVVDSTVWLSAIATAALAEGLPGAVVASLALGWGAAALAQFCLGTPAATPSIEDLSGAVTDLGVDPTGLRRAPEQGWGSTKYTADGDVWIDVVSRDSSDARFLAKLWRFVWYKDSGPTFSLTRAAQVEHQAYVALLADQTGASVPDLLAAGVAGLRQDAIVAVRNPPGDPLSDLAPDQITDGVLDDAWSNLRLLHDEGLAHGNPWVGNVVLDGDGTTGLVGLEDALSSASDTRLRLDRVQLLATTAELVGEDRALGAAQRALPDDELVDLLGFLEPTALTSAAKRHVTKAKALLKALRDKGAELTGVEPPELTELHRVSASSVVMAAGLAIGVYLLVGQLAGVAAMGNIFEDAIWGWVLVTFVVAQLPQFSQATAMLGAVSAQLPFGPVLGVQFANAFTGLVGGTAGNATLTIRFFQKQGLPPVVAASSGVLTSTTGFIVQTVLIVTAVIVTGAELDLSTGDGGVPGWVAVLVGVIVVGGIVTALVPSFRKKVYDPLVKQLKTAWENLHGVLVNPKKAIQLFGGNLLSQLLFAMVLGAALHAYGESLPILQLVLINSLASLVGGVAPVPGGMGVIETGMIAGFTASGIPEAQAVAATFTARMCTSYLPPIWGWFTLQWLRKSEYV